MTYYTYILTNWNNKVMYIGITNNLERRLYEHRHHSQTASRTNTTSTNWSTMNPQPMSKLPLPEKNS